MYSAERSSSLIVELIPRSEEHTSELQSRLHLVCRLLLEKKKTQRDHSRILVETIYSSEREIIAPLYLPDGQGHSHDFWHGLNILDLLLIPLLTALCHHGT